MSFLTEADTCRRYVLPKLYAAGWTDEQISEQRSFTDGRIVVAGTKVKRRPQKRADYLLRYRRDFPIAVVEAKAVYANPGDGLQQAKEYAQILGLKFAYATNGQGIVEHDFLTGRDNDLEDFPSADDLWSRLRESEGIDERTAERVLAPYYHLSGKSPRYYQEIAINRAVQAILQNKQRVLLTLATGTGKTVIAFQICYKLWNSRWNRTGEHRKPRILYLADRNVLLDVPKDQTFAPFGDARWKIEGEAVKSREMYFATYQAIAEDERRPGLYRDFPRDFLLENPSISSQSDICRFQGVCSAEVYPICVSSPELDPHFVKWALVAEPFTNYANRLSGRTRMPKLNRKQLFGFEFTHPSLHEQQRIVADLNDLQRSTDTLKALQAETSAGLDALMPSILDKAFRGELQPDLTA